MISGTEAQPLWVAQKTRPTSPLAKQRHANPPKLSWPLEKIIFHECGKRPHPKMRKTRFTESIRRKHLTISSKYSLTLRMDMGIW